MKQLFYTIFAFFGFIKNVVCDSVEMTDSDIPCDVIAGMERDMYVIPFDDWKTATLTWNDATEKYLNAIVLASGKQAYKVRNQPSQIGAKVNSQISDAKTLEYTTEITGYLTNDTNGKITAQYLGTNEVVVIAEQKYKGTLKNEAFQVFGTTGGLRATQAQDSATNKNLLVMTFATQEGVMESKPPVTFTTDETADTYTADKAYLEALLTPAS